MSLPEQRRADHLVRLVLELANFQTEGVLTDVTFRVDGNLFHSHRVILCAASPPFRQMLASSFVEAADEPVDIQDVSAVAFKALLDFIYTGEIASITPDNTADILQIADRYCMESMTKFCIDYIMNGNINLENCCALLNTSSGLGDSTKSLLEPLVNATASFAAKHILELMRRPGSEGFLQLSKRSMFAVIAAAMRKIEQQPILILELWDLVLQWAQSNFGFPPTLDGFYKGMIHLGYDDLYFIESVSYSHEINNIPADDNTVLSWHNSEPFTAHGYEFILEVSREMLHHNKYTLCLEPMRPRPMRHGWGLFVAGQFCPIRSASVSHCGINPVTTGMHFERCWASFSVARVEHADAAYVVANSLTFCAQVKVNPLLGLCSAAACLSFVTTPQLVLATLDPDVLTRILKADDLPIRNEHELLNALKHFTQSEAADRAQKVTCIVNALRLEYIEFTVLLDSIKSLPSLKESHTMEYRLREYVKKRQRMKWAKRLVDEWAEPERTRLADLLVEEYEPSPKRLRYSEPAPEETDDSDADSDDKDESVALVRSMFQPIGGSCH